MMNGYENENLFSALFRWGDSKKKPENYYTKNLAFILNHLLQNKDDRQRKLGQKILNSIIGEALGFEFEVNDDIYVQPHIKTDRSTKIPDLTVIGDDVKVCVEIKVDSKVDERARSSLRCYWNDLKGLHCKHGLILISRFADQQVDDIPLKQISWFKVGSVLQKAFEEASREFGHEVTGAYFVKAFCGFLKENSMSLEKTDDIVDSHVVYNTINLLTTIEVVCKELKLRPGRLKIEKWSEPDETDEISLGYWCSRGNYFVGFYGNKPSKPVQLYFEVHDNNKVKKAFKNDEQVKRKLGNNAELWDGIIGISLDLVSAGFFADATSEEKQAQKIKNFVKTKLDHWSKHNKK